MYLTLLIALVVSASTISLAGQCQSVLCKSTGDSCRNDFPPYCRGAGCLSSDWCIVYIGHCSTVKQPSCYARVCADFHLCPPNPNFASGAVFSTQGGVVTYVYRQTQGSMVGSPTITAFDQGTTDNFSNAAWLIAHEDYNRTESFLGFTCYVHRFSIGTDVVERWYAPQIGPMALKTVVKDSSGNEIVAQEAISVGGS